jgi:hypothetical protein
MTDFEAWAVGLGISAVILAKVTIIVHLVRQSGPDRFGALVLAAVLGFGLVSVILGAAVWLMLAV